MPRKPTGGVHGVRLNPQQDERSRSAIKTTKIIQRLNCFVLNEDWEGRKVEMTAQQVNAANILLRKTIPDLSSIEVGGDGGGPLVVQILKYSDVVGDK